MNTPDTLPNLANAAWAAVRRWSGDARLRALGYIIAVVLFTGGIGVAWSRAGITVKGIEVGTTFAVALIGVPLQVLFGGLLLRALAEPDGHPPALPRVCRVIGLGTLSSVLPVSSGTVVRGAALMVWGLPSMVMFRTLALDALLWAALALALSGGALVASGAMDYGYACLVAAAGIGLPSFLVTSRLMAQVAWRTVFWRLAGILVDVARLWGCFAALAQPVDYGQAAVLAAAGPLSSLLFFLPGGLGVRELATAGFAYAAALDPSVAFLAASLNRILGYAAIGAFELLLAAHTALRFVRTDGGVDEN